MAITKKRLEEMGFTITSTWRGWATDWGASAERGTVDKRLCALQVWGYTTKAGAMRALLSVVNRLAAEPAKEKETKGGERP